MSTQTLPRLLITKEPTSLIIIEDTIKQSSAQLLKEFIRVAAAQRNKVIVCCVERSVDEVGKLVDTSVSPIIIDLFSSLSWYESVLREEIITANKDTIVGVLQDVLKDGQEKNALIVFDSMSPLLLQYPIGTVARLIKSLSAIASETTRIILPFHSDIPNSSSDPSTPPIPTILANASTTYITIRHGKDFGVDFGEGSGSADTYEPTDANCPSGGICEILHKKKSGKIVREVIGYRLSSDGRGLKFSTVDELRGIEEDLAKLDVKENETGEQPDPTANLSFNLRLTDAQKEARERVVLPYMKAQEQDGVEVQKMGTIYYEPDDDDYDEEDPDADLDI